MTAPSAVPSADRRPHSFTRHGIAVEDPYAWLRDPGYPEVTDRDVLSYLEEENAFFEAAMQPRKALTDRLFEARHRHAAMMKNKVGHRAYSSKIATARVHPALAPLILCGKQLIMKPVEGIASRLCIFSMWQ